MVLCTAALGNPGPPGCNSYIGFSHFLLLGNFFVSVCLLQRLRRRVPGHAVHCKPHWHATSSVNVYHKIYLTFSCNSRLPGEIDGSRKTDKSVHHYVKEHLWHLWRTSRFPGTVWKSLPSRMLVPDYSISEIREINNVWHNNLASKGLWIRINVGFGDGYLCLWPAPTPSQWLSASFTMI